MFPTFWFGFFSDYNKTSDGWLEWRGNQYFINTARMAMEDARYFCQQRHGDLATINSEAENIFLWQQVIILRGNCCQHVWFILWWLEHTKCLTDVYLCILCRCMILIPTSGLVWGWTLINHFSEYKFNAPGALSAGWSAF